MDCIERGKSDESGLAYFGAIVALEAVVDDVGAE